MHLQYCWILFATLKSFTDQVQNMNETEITNFKKKTTAYLDQIKCIVSNDNNFILLDFNAGHYQSLISIISNLLLTSGVENNPEKSICIKISEIILEYIEQISINVLEINDDFTKETYDSFIYDGLMHLIDKRNLSFYDYYKCEIPPNSNSIVMTCNFTVIGLREELENQLGLSIEQSFLDKTFLYDKWTECKCKFIETIQTYDIKLIICQKIFDFKFRTELYEKFSVFVYDQVSILYIYKFSECLNVQQTIDKAMSISELSKTANIGVCTGASIKQFGKSEYFCIDADSLQTCIIYNQFPEFFDFKSTIESSFEEFKSMLCNNHIIHGGNYLQYLWCKFEVFRKVLVFPKFLNGSCINDTEIQSNIGHSAGSAGVDTKQYLEDSNKSYEAFESYSTNKKLMMEVIEIIRILIRLAPCVYMRKKE